MNDRKFVDPKTFLGKTVYLEIDRPLGSKHPKWDFVYPINYGFVPNQPSPDGENLDAYVLGVCESLANFTGKCIAIIHRVNDDHDKLVVTSEDVDHTDDQIMALVEFQEQFFKSIILR